MVDPTAGADAVYVGNKPVPMEAYELDAYSPDGVLRGLRLTSGPHAWQSLGGDAYRAMTPEEFGSLAAVAFIRAYVKPYPGPR
jgi:hypothetical protein